jgi:hypothetical protein
MKFLILAALAVWSVSIPQSSRQPAKGFVQKNGPSGSQPAADSQKNQQSANTEAIQSILSAVTNIQQQQAEEQKEGASDKQETIKVEWWLIWVAVVQAIALFLTILAIMRQTRILKDTAQRQLRAYVCVSSVLLKFPKPNVPEIQVCLKNSGQTPAYNVRGWIHMWIEEYPLRIVLPQPPADFQKSRQVMGPDCACTFVNVKDPPISVQSLPLLGTTKGTIFGYGEVQYKDAFDIERYTKYRFIYGGREGVRKSKPDSAGVVTALLKPDTDGNEAN